MEVMRPSKDAAAAAETEVYEPQLFYGVKEETGLHFMIEWVPMIRRPFKTGC